MDIKTRPSNLLPGMDAMIVPDSEGKMTIVWNDRLPKKRTNFSVAHEIGHTLFPGCAQMVNFRHGIHGDPAQELETLCDIAAAEFLMPYQDFSKDLETFGAGLEAVQRLSARYQASYEAIAIRVQYATREPLAMFVCGTNSGNALTIHYGFVNEAFDDETGLWFEPGAVVPRYSIAQKALRSPLRLVFSSSREIWRSKYNLHTLDVEVMSVPSAPGQPPRVLALVRPS